jgi:hypothetical protein
MKTNYYGLDRVPFWKCAAALGLAMVASIGLWAAEIGAGCIELDDVPLDVQQQSAPGIVMFAIDDSGSMDWEYVCQGQADGKFLGNTEYIFADPGDNVYGEGDGNGTILENSATNKNKWQSQWSGHNRLYYDPASTYKPWPTFTGADPDTPRSNPAVSGNTLDLSAVYHDFGEPLMSTEALENAGAIFVDNRDTEAGQGLAAEIIMDNVAANNDIMWDGRNFGSFTTSGQSWSTTTSSNDFETNYHYTGTKNKTYTANWSFTNIPTGNYDVYAWWIGGSSFSTAVKYYVNGVNTATVNQENNGGEWVKIASNQNFAGSGVVSLIHANPNNNNNRACADAVKIVPLFPAVPPVLFEKTGPVSGLADQGWVLNTDSNAYQRPQDSYGTYYYTNAVGAFSATWTANNLDPGQTYDVYALWAQGGTNRYNAVPYTTYHDGGTTVTSVNQQLDLGDWTRIAGGDDGITFAGGIGRVVLNRTTTSSSSGRACADAIAFVPHGSTAIKINRAHYYTQTTSGTYLVNINNNTIAYYKFTDINNDGIVQGNELNRLTVKPTDILTAGRTTYSQERQNFANWYSFYRKRELTAKNAIANVINDMQGVYIGLSCINAGLKSIAKPVRVTTKDAAGVATTADESAVLFTTVYGYNSGGNTPLRIGLNNVGKYFMGTLWKPTTLPSTDLFGSDTYPFYKTDKGGECQPAFTIIMTDGFYNDSFSSVGNADGDNNTDYDGPPFGDTESNTLADVAMYYYENDLNSALDDYVPINAKDSAYHQHLVTYTLSFGQIGDIDQEANKDCPLGDCPNPWPSTSTNAGKIDDMFHAAVNGRGKYVNASSPQEMVDRMNELRQDIESRLGSSASLATSSIQRQVGTKIYQGTYNTAGWFGEVNALEIDVETGSVGAVVWKASNHVPAWETRNILSHNGSSGIEFEFANISEAQETALAYNSIDPANPFDPAEIVDFIRGDTSNNISHGGTLRVRAKPIGDFVHSAPTYYNGMIYIGSNDGMLHAMDALTGQEKFCYVPARVYDHLSDLASPSYSHKYYVDNTPAIGRVNGKDILVCGLGKGGKGIFGLDVTNPGSMTPSHVLWEFPSTADDDMGYSFSEVVLVNTKASGRVAVFGNGYDSVNQKAVLYIVNPETGALIRKLDTFAGGCNGLSTPRLVDTDGDAYADFAFAGDLSGNMWKFDLRGYSTTDWKVYFQGSVPTPLIQAFNDDGEVQAITAAPEVMLDCAKSPFSKNGDGLMVIFGTGKYLNTGDFGDDTTQSFYGVWDWSDIWEKKSGYDVAKGKYLGSMQTGRVLSNVSGKSLQEQTVDAESGEWLVLSNNPVNWFDPDTSTGDHMGWFFDLPEKGERGIREPQLRMGVAVLISTIPSSSPCEAGGSSVLYQVSACSGGWTDEPQFDVNGDGKIDEEDRTFDGSAAFDPNIDYNNDGVIDQEDLKFFLKDTDYNGDGKIDSSDLALFELPPTGKKFGEMLFEGIEIGDLLYLSDSQGNINPMQVPRNLVGLQYWRIMQ